MIILIIVLKTKGDLKFIDILHFMHDDQLLIEIEILTVFNTWKKFTKSIFLPINLKLIFLLMVEKSTQQNSRLTIKSRLNKFEITLNFDPYYIYVFYYVRSF